MSESESNGNFIVRRGPRQSDYDAGHLADDTPVEVQTRDDFAHSLMERGVDPDVAYAEAAEAGTKGFTVQEKTKNVSLKTRNRPEAVEGNGHSVQTEQEADDFESEFESEPLQMEQATAPQEQPYSHRQTLEAVHRDLSQKHTQSLQRGEQGFRQWAQQSGWTPQQTQQTWHQMIGPTLREMQSAYQQAFMEQAKDLRGLLKEHERDLREQGWKSKDEYERSMRRYGASREGRVTQSGNYVNGNGHTQTVTPHYSEMTTEQRSKLTAEERDAAISREVTAKRNRRR